MWQQQFDDKSLICIWLFCSQRYEEWRDGLPDFKWLDEVLPDTEQWNKFSNNLKTITNSVRDSIEIGMLSLGKVQNSIDTDRVFSYFQTLDWSNWVIIKWQNGGAGSTRAWTTPSKRHQRKNIQKLRVSNKTHIPSCQTISYKNDFHSQSYSVYIINTCIFISSKVVSNWLFDRALTTNLFFFI